MLDVFNFPISSWIRNCGGRSGFALCRNYGCHRIEGTHAGKTAIYAKEKLGTATQILVIHPGRIKDRLRAAAKGIILIPQDGIPDYEDVDRDISWIKEQLTSREEEQFEGQGKIAATIHKMRNDKATEIASYIFTAYIKLGSYISKRLY